MRCAKCAGCLVDEHGEERCVNCGFRPGFAVLKPAPVDTRGRYQRVSSLHVCECGHAKVPWRTYCRGCLDRLMEYYRKKAAKDKSGVRKAVQREFVI